MTDITDKIIATMNAQKGELIGIHAMLAAIARSIPQHQLAVLLSEFDTEVDLARSHLNNSPVPDEVIAGLENFVKMWNCIRTEPNQF